MSGKKQKVDTPRDGKAWCDTVNTAQPLPSIIGNMTLEGMRDADRGYRIGARGERIPVLPPVRSVIGEITAQQKEDQETAKREAIFRRMHR